MTDPLEEMMLEAAEWVSRNRNDKALGLLKKAGKKWPLEPLVFFNQGMVLYLDKKFKAAEKAFRQSVTLGGEDPDLFNQWGLSLDHLNRRKEAREAYFCAIEVDPEFWKAWNNLGVLAFLEEDYPQAKEFFTKTLELNPHNRDTWYNLRDTLRELGDETGALHADQRYHQLR